MTLARSWMAALAASLFAQPVLAQSDGELHFQRLIAVPIGALPPVAILMPASRNHNYWVARTQVGRLLMTPGDRNAVGVGADLQWRGGSAFGLTSGYQWGSCPVTTDCPNHAFYGGRARINLITGGPTFASLIGDASATTTLGTELGVGYAPNAYRGSSACAVDVAVPISLSMFQLVRVVSFFSPGIAWDVRCPMTGSTGGVGASFVTAAGIGFHQLGARGLDVTLGTQKIFRKDAGIHIGIGVTYTRLP
jgi:hypothetical protein